MARSEYYDGCPSAHALDLIGDRWALLVVRELLLGPKRFTDILRGLPKISRNVLSQRLADLESAQVLRRRTLPPPAAAAVYELTERGLQLDTVLEAIGRWGAESPLLPESDTVGFDTFVLGLRRRFDPGSAPTGGGRRYVLRSGQDAFTFAFEKDGLSIRRGSEDASALMIDVVPTRMAAVARGAAPVVSALEAGDDASQKDVVAFAAAFE